MVTRTPADAASGAALSPSPRRRSLVLAITAAPLSLAVAPPAVAGAAPAPHPRGWFRLPRHPSQHPAAVARRGSDGSLLLSLPKGDGRMATFRLNRRAEQLWRMCDRHLDLAEIAREHAARTGLPEAGARRALEAMVSAGLIVIGGWCVAGGAMPLPPAGGCFRHRTPPRAASAPPGQA